LSQQNFNIDSKMPVGTIYLDLAKAFDKVPYKRLILKLKAHGIDGIVFNFTTSSQSMAY